MSNHVEKAYDDYFIAIYNDQLDALLGQTKPTTAVVFLALMRYANRRQGMSCFPKLETLASDAGVSRRTVVDAIKELKAVGLVTIEQRYKDDGSQTSNLYRIHRVAKSADPHANDVPEGGTQIACPPPPELHPNQMSSNADVSEPLETGATTKILPRDIVNVWAEVCNGGAWPVNKGPALRAAKTLVDGGITPDDARSLIAWMQADDFWGKKAGIDLGKMVKAADAWRSRQSAAQAKRERLVY